MDSDFISYGTIVAAIAVLVVGFTAWSKAAPKSRKLEQTIFGGVSLFAAVALLWDSIDAYLVWRETGIDTMHGSYLSMAKIAGIAVLFGVAFCASKAKEKEERSTSTTSEKRDKNA